MSNERKGKRTRSATFCGLFGVERTHNWMTRFRSILIRWSKKAQHYVALLHLSFAIIIHRRME